MSENDVPSTAAGWAPRLRHARRLEPAELKAAATLLQTVIDTTGHRGVGQGALEALGGDGGGLAITAPDPEAPGGVPAGLAFGQRIDGQVWNTELTVRPDRRGHRLGSALLDAVLAAAPPDTTPQVWAYLPGPVHEHLAAKHHLTPVRHLHHLRGPTAGHQAPELPGLRLRGLTEDDLPALVTLHNTAFTYELLDLDSLRTRLARPHMDAGHVLVAEPTDPAAGSGLAGYVWMASPRPDGEGEGAGELVLLAVHPDWQGHHLGQALTAAGLELLARRGVVRCMLYMDGANTPAARVYERAGFTLHHVDVCYGVSQTSGPRI